MSTIKANTLLHSDGSTTNPPAIPALDQRMASAWINFNGTSTVAIKDSYNVSSITDNGTGQYSVVFSTTMSDANYAAVTAGMAPVAGDGKATGTYTFNHTTTRCSITNLNHSNSFQDVGGLSLVVMGGQA